MPQGYIQEAYLPFPVVRLKPQKKNSDCGSLSVPREILLEICKNLSDTNILAVSQTCKTLYHELSDDGFWIALSKRRELVISSYYFAYHLET